MAYSTVANIKQEAGFTNNSNITEATVTRHLTAADSQIDSVIGKLYTLPLASTPGLIERISRYLAAGSLMLEEYGTEAEGTSKDGKAKIDAAMKDLNSIASGLITLVDSSGVPLAANTTSGVYMNGWPDDTTGTDITDAADKDDPPQFERGMVF